MENGFRRSKFRKYLTNILAGVAFTGIFIIYGPYFNAKLKNIDLNLNSNHEYILKRERNQLEDLVNKYDKSRTNEMLNTFDQIVDFGGITNKIISEFRLKDYEKEIERKVLVIPDIEAYSDFWVLLGKMRVPGFHFNAEAFNDHSTVFLNQTANSFSSEILKHEYTHSIGGVYSIFNITNKNLLDLNEGLTQHFANKIFDDNYIIYYAEQKLVKVLEEISGYIEKKQSINYNILAKCFFIDNSIDEFIQRFDNNFGIGKFNSIFYENNLDDKINKFNDLLNKVKINN